MKVGRRTSDSSHHIYLWQRRWAMVLIATVGTKLNDLPGDGICDIAIYADDPTLYSKCDQVSDLWQQLELASELKFDL